MRYKADITAGALKVPESRLIADLLLRNLDEQAWHDAILVQNILQARSTQTAKRLTLLIRGRLQGMETDLWRLVRDGSQVVAIHAAFAAAVKASALLGDFLDLVVREHYRVFSPTLPSKDWNDYIDECRGRDPAMPAWQDTTLIRLRSSVFQILAQAGYIENTRTRKLQPVHLAPEVLQYLHQHDESYVLRCIQVSP